jgi:hypothetical protein
MSRSSSLMAAAHEATTAYLDGILGDEVPG